MDIKIPQNYVQAHTEATVPIPSAENVKRHEAVDN